MYVCMYARHTQDTLLIYCVCMYVCMAVVIKDVVLANEAKGFINIWYSYRG